MATKGEKAAKKNLPCGSRVRRRSAKVFIWIAAAIAGVWLSGVRVFAFHGESMIPEAGPGDYLVGLTGVWRHRMPERFDMLIFDLPPHSKWAERKIPWMKRLVGLPGEHVRLSGAQLFIDGRRVESRFLHSARPSGQLRDFDVQLRADEFCVLGDNLDHSLEDSRSFGAISRPLIKGHVAFVLRRSKGKGATTP